MLLQTGLRTPMIRMLLEMSQCPLKIVLPKQLPCLPCRLLLKSRMGLNIFRILYIKCQISKEEKTIRNQNIVLEILWFALKKLDQRNFMVELSRFLEI